jgi:hypothetical protein
MESFPKLGMTYEQVRTRLRKYESIKKKDNSTLRDSLIRQAMLHEGEGAGTELLKEHTSEPARNRYSGAGNRSHGYGSGKREKEAGKYRYVNGEWIKV